MTDYRKKLKTRLYIAISYALIGLVMWIAALILKTDNTFISPFGIALFICGVVRIRNYFMITRNDKQIRRQEIRETDERNIAIVNKARSITFIIYILLAGVAVIVLQFLNMPKESQLIAYNVCFILVVYWISYLIMRKKY